MKKHVKALFSSFGYEVRRIQPAASHLRVIGNITSFLQDVKARGFYPKFVLDVGASDGSWSQIAKSEFPDASFLLLEPRPYLQNKLESFCQKYPKSHFKMVAAGAAAGSVKMTDWDTASTLLPVPANGASVFEVPVVTCDELFQADSAPDLVKLDVEGFEIEVLRGAASLFGKTELFIIEVGMDRYGTPRPMAYEVINFMASRDYHIYDIPGFIRRPCDGAVGLMDICFAFDGGLLRRNSHKWHQE